LRRQKRELEKVVKKKLIELFGNWYHSKEFAERHGIKYKSLEDRIKHFKKFGFDVLIVWERELKDLDRIKQKILTFNQTESLGGV